MASIITRSYDSSLIHRMFFSALLHLLTDTSLVSSIAPSMVTDPSLVSSVAPSIDHWFITCTPSLAHWSIACIIRRSFYWSLIHRLYYPALLQLLTDQPLLSSIAISIAQWSIACTPSLAHRSIACTIKRSFDCSLIHRLLKSQSELHNVTPMQKQIACNIIMYT